MDGKTLAILGRVIRLDVKGFIMQIYFDPQNVLHIAAENTVELMALKYWAQEYKEHGDKLLEVDIENPTILLGSDR
jgi:hypothetical protein